MNRCASALALFALILLGCREPRLAYEIPADLKARGVASYCLDPRDHLAVVLEGKRLLDPEPFRGIASAILQAKGYRLVPPEQAAAWLEVRVFTSAAGSERGHGTGGPPAGGEPRGAGAGGRAGGRGSRKGGGAARAEGSGPRGEGGTTIVVRLLHPADSALLWQGQVVVRPRQPRGPGIEAELAELLAPLPDRRR